MAIRISNALFYAQLMPLLLHAHRIEQSALREALQASGRVSEPPALESVEQASSHAYFEQTAVRETLQASGPVSERADHQFIQQPSSNTKFERNALDEALIASAPVLKPAAHQFVRQSILKASFHELWASAKSGEDDIQAGIDKVATIFSILAIAYFVYLIILQNPKIAEELQKRDEEMGKLLGHYNRTVDDMSSKLKHLMDLQIQWTEHELNGHRKDFAKFLNFVKARPDFFGVPTSELVDHFRRFVTSWLTVYRACSRKPIEKPRVIISEEKLNQCKSVSEVAELVGQRLSAEKIEFLLIEQRLSSSDDGWSNPFSQKCRWRRDSADHSLEDSEVPEIGHTCSWLNCFGLNRNFIMIEEPDKEDGWPFTIGIRCCGLTLLSPMHLFIVLSFIFGLCLLAVEVTHRRFASVLLLTGDVALFAVLLRFEQIDDLARLEVECGKLQDGNADIEKHHADLVDFCDATGDAADLWFFRTIPCLTLLKEVALKLEDECQGNPDLTMQLCEVSERGMAIIDQCAGPMEFWERLDCGRGLKVLKRGIETCAEFVEKNDVPTIIEQPDIWDIVRVVRVRIHAVNNLSRWRPVSKIDPYVRVRIGDADWVRTRTIANEQNPRWSEKEDKDLQFRPRFMSEKLEVQIMHEVCLDKVLEDGTVCMAAIDLSDVAPGNWQRIREPLLTAKGGRAGHGQRFEALREVKEEDQSTIELSVYVCRSLEQMNMLPGFKDQHGSHARNSLRASLLQ